MTEINLRNKALLSTLDGFIDEFFHTKGYDNPEHVISAKKIRTDHMHPCSRDYLEVMLENQEYHEGFPETHMAQPMSSMVANDHIWSAFRDKVRYDFAKTIGAQHNALINYYPPMGHVGWHTNWNANCYQVLFTWSKNGDGYFRYYDQSQDKIITVQDKPGWQARHYYFGRKDEPEHHCWHSAWAGCDRITLAYKFINGSKINYLDETARLLRDHLIEEMESEE
tara:strand:- start:946 stop:1617 length:672 start_codon:yes stop_codon:yes gene_type:complete